MAGVSWVKLYVDMFDHKKIKYIRKLPDGNDILLCWVMLIASGGKCNAGGYIFLIENIPYTAEGLADEFQLPLNTVKLALQTFQRLNMITIDENGILILGWEEYQNISGLEKIREQSRKRVALHRQKQKELGCNVTGNVTVTHGRATELDLELDLDLDKDKEKESTKKRRNKFAVDSTPYQLALYLQTVILARDPNTKTTDNLQAWALEADRMLRLDNREPKAAAQLMQWCQKDPFWCANVLSMSKFRKSYDMLKRQSERKQPSEPEESDIDRMLREEGVTWDG